MSLYTFRRRAQNESYSGRTAKVGKPYKGEFKQALKFAIIHAKIEGSSITVHDEHSKAVATVGFYKDDTTEWVRITVLANEHLDNLLR